VGELITNISLNMKNIYKQIVIIAFSSFFVYNIIMILIERKEYKDIECIGVVTEIKYVEGNRGIPSFKIHGM
jgi:hypothetical protein